jgi:hypothetical protein
VVAHGAILRIYEKNPLVADQVAVNYRKADITPRQKAMLDFAIEGLPRIERDRRGRLRGDCASTASATRTPGTSRRSPPCSASRTGWRTPPRCAERRVLPARAACPIEVFEIAVAAARSTACRLHARASRSDPDVGCDRIDR